MALEEVNNIPLNNAAITEFEKFCTSGNQEEAIKLLLTYKALALRPSTILLAAQHGLSEVVVELIKLDANINVTTKEGFTPLHLASEGGKLEVAEEFIKAKTHIEATTEEGKLAVVVELIKAKAHIEATTELGFTPLHIAAQYGKVKVVKKLIKAEALIDATTKKGFTPLHLASSQGKLEVVEELIKAKADINAKAPKGHTPLHIAAQYGQVKVVKELIKAEAQLEATTKLGSTPLHIASEQGHLAVVVELIQAKAQLEATTEKGLTPLHLASEKGEVEVVEELIKAKAQLEATTKYKETPLYLASEKGKVEVVAKLIEKGAKVEAKTEEEFTPLHIASEQGHLAVVVELIKAKAQLEATTDLGATALHLASEKGKVEVIEKLMEKGAKVDAKIKDGRTPLHIASANGLIEVIDTLLYHNADLEITNNEGMSVLDRMCAKINDGLKVPLGLIFLSKSNSLEKITRILDKASQTIIDPTKKAQIDSLQKIAIALHDTFFHTKEDTTPQYDKIKNLSINDLIKQCVEDNTFAPKEVTILYQSTKKIIDDYLMSKIPEATNEPTILEFVRTPLYNSLGEYKISKVKPLWMLALLKIDKKLVQEYESKNAASKLPKIKLSNEQDIEGESGYRAKRVKHSNDISSPEEVTSAPDDNIADQGAGMSLTGEDTMITPI